MKLPIGPNEMPSAQHNNENWIRNVMVTLDQYSCVSMDWERDEHMTRETGETHGEWNVMIDTGRRQFTAKHAEITNALWYVTTIANAHLESVHDAQVKARAAALAKLTDEEKRLLRVQ